MCLAIYKDYNFLIAKKDITIYKIVRIYKGLYYSPFVWHKYELGKTYSETINFSKRKWKGVCFDCLEQEKVRKLSDYLSVRFITKGFHFSFTKKRLTESDAYKTNSKDLFIVKGIIPKGSKYIVGIDKNLGVSDTIILY